MHAAFVSLERDDREELWDETPTPSGVQPIVRARYPLPEDDGPEIHAHPLHGREAAEIALYELAHADALRQLDDDDDELTAEYLVPRFSGSDFPPQVIEAWIALEVESRLLRRAHRFDDPLLDGWLRT